MPEVAGQAAAKHRWADVLLGVYVGASMLFIFGIPLVGAWLLIVLYFVGLDSGLLLPLLYGGAFLIGLFPVDFAVRTFATGIMRFVLVTVLTGCFSYFGIWLASRVMYEIMAHPGLD